LKYYNTASNLTNHIVTIDGGLDWMFGFIALIHLTRNSN
jgi:hypothetical protein